MCWRTWTARWTTASSAICRCRTTASSSAFRTCSTARSPTGSSTSSPTSSRRHWCVHRRTRRPAAPPVSGVHREASSCVRLCGAEGVDLFLPTHSHRCTAHVRSPRVGAHVQIDIRRRKKEHADELAQRPMSAFTSLAEKYKVHRSVHLLRPRPHTPTLHTERAGLGWWLSARVASFGGRVSPTGVGASQGGANRGRRPDGRSVGAVMLTDPAAGAVQGPADDQRRQCAPEGRLLRATRPTPDLHCACAATVASRQRCLGQTALLTPPCGLHVASHRAHRAFHRTTCMRWLGSRVYRGWIGAG